MYFGMKMTEMIQSALDRLALGETIEYDFAMAPVQTEQGMMPVYMVKLMAPTIVLGQWAVYMGMVPNQRPSQEEIDAVVTEGLRQINQQKAEHSRVISGNGSQA